MSLRLPLARCLRAGRSFGRGNAATVALQPTDCEVWPESRVALVGPSGSGKSTLLYLLSGIDSPTVGDVAWPAIGRSGQLRPGPIAMVFQGPSLLPELTVEENVALPLVLEGHSNDFAHSASRESLAALGLTNIANKLPDEISGGQSQRAAVARALTGRPLLILADEPTGQLDHASAATVIDALVGAADQLGAALVVSTHDRDIADRLPMQWEIRDGQLLDSTEQVSKWSR